LTDAPFELTDEGFGLMEVWVKGERIVGWLDGWIVGLLDYWMVGLLDGLRLFVFR
jgi:hypothetical protein